MIRVDHWVRRVAFVLAAGVMAAVISTGIPAYPPGSVADLNASLTGSGSPLSWRTPGGAFATVQAAQFMDRRASSAVEVTGPAAAAGPKISVSQTTNLVNQTIEISWKGAKPTEGTPDFGANYLQIMQCWGNSSPDRKQCQFGGKAAFDLRGGINASSRQVNQSSYLDPKEALTKNLPAQSDAFVPFDPVSCDGLTVARCEKDKQVKGRDTLKNPYFDQSTTNEIPFAATRGDGTGFETFETQTYREAPGLGCGDIILTGKLKGQPRACWLVIVPRGETEVDGTDYSTIKNNTGTHRLDTSPLSQANWDKRIVVPLRFAAVGQVCPIAAKQRPLGGAEPAAEAVLRWQPALCRNKGPVFSYTQTADSVAQRKLAGATPAMALLTAPVPPAQVPSDR